MRVVLPVVICLAVVSVALADVPPCRQVQYAGETILRFHVGVGGRTPEQRAVEVHQQMVEAMSAIFASNRPFDAKCVVIRRVHCAPYRHEIWFGSIRLVGITQADADANGCCTQQLAAIWAANLRRALYKATHDC